MRTSVARPGAGRPRSALLAAALAALALVLAACGSGQAGAPVAPITGGGGTQDGPPRDALAMTATAGRFQLPPGTPGVGRPPVVLGSKDFAEQDLLGELYAQALRAKGYTIVPRPRVGSSEVIDEAFAANQIQMYPEYLGEIATGSTMAGLRTPPSDASTAYRTAQQFEQSRRQAQILAQAPYQNIDTIIVTPEFARQYNLRTVEDLKNVGPNGQGVRIAAQPPFRTRFAGLTGMASQYGLTALEPGFVGVAAGPPVYQALDGGQANAADAFSTDPQLLGNRYVRLEDPKNIFGSQYLAPVVKQATVAEQGPEFEQTANWVSGLLTVSAVQQMNQAAAGGQGPADVARTFLTQNGLR